MAMTITSPSFVQGGEIPGKFTCEGQDLAPELRISGVPPGAKSLALIMDDPDAPDPAHPKMTYVHWVVFNLPANTDRLPESGALPAGALPGSNDWKKPTYGGPCPPIGRHRYFFKLYALDTALDLRLPSKSDLEKAMAGHVLAQAELMGTYQKAKR